MEPGRKCREVEQHVIYQTNSSKSFGVKTVQYSRAAQMLSLSFKQRLRPTGVLRLERAPRSAQVWDGLERVKRMIEAVGLYAPLTMTSNYFVSGKAGQGFVLAHSFAHMEVFLQHAFTLKAMALGR
eukprot:6193526-Amphidinium_carterae.1